MTDRKLMQQALELTYHPCTSILIEGLKKLKAWDVLAEWDKAREIVDKRLLTPLAQPEQPVQTATYTCGVCGVSMQMEQTEQEPVAWRYNHITAPPQRTWVEASEKEVRKLIPKADVWKYEVGHDEAIKLIRSALALAKEKNT